MAGDILTSSRTPDTQSAAWCLGCPGVTSSLSFLCFSPLSQDHLDPLRDLRAGAAWPRSLPPELQPCSRFLLGWEGEVAASLLPCCLLCSATLGRDFPKARGSPGAFFGLFCSYRRAELHSPPGLGGFRRHAVSAGAASLKSVSTGWSVPTSGAGFSPPPTLAFCLAGLGSAVGTGSPCEKACNPRMGNLAHGRALRTETACGRHATELFCAYTEDAQRRCKLPTCSRCSGAHAGLAHPPAAMADSPFRLPRTWWQSAQDASRETIRLDLEAAFYFTHLILVFKSPRPAAMVLERSQDFGETWMPYKYFAANCSATFGLEDDVSQRGAICTSRYSSPFPCTGGEVGLPGSG